jgi:chorismate mutase
VNIRGIRGATTAASDSKDAIEEVVVELLLEMFKINSLTEADLISIFFTSTPDLKSEFPATAARKVGLSDTPLICAQELDISGALPRTIRVLIHAQSELAKSEVEHVYLREAISLRKDLKK